MKEAKPTPSSPPTDSAPSAQPANISPGMATLLRGNHETPKTQDPPQAKPAGQPGRTTARPKLTLLKLSLVLADLLLAGLAARLVWRKGGSFGSLEISLSILALALGAWLTCLALWFGGGDEEPK